ncbi:hypothetical protein BT63DRAFT_426752 [Microthyrium microscopicum]|uniref:F-box domain-containing protein n=1 Tax=Microthyrium microscopicum TaxID=703497 RepID=A0A6A6UAH4_9PEZI|nr:hypothetical protein BT63DRAFT_426752 [Microthyrium microscopicum]
MSSSDTTISFGGLPPELRVMIYRELLVLPSKRQHSNTPIIKTQPDWSKGTEFKACIHIHRETSGLFPQILRTCKKLKGEAEEVLYGENSFLIRLHGWSGDCCLLSTRQANYIKHFLWMVYPSALPVSVAAILQQFPSLRTVRAISYWPCTYSDIQSQEMTKCDNSLGVIAHLSETLAIHSLICEFRLPICVPDFGYNEPSSAFQRAYDDWYPDAGGIALKNFKSSGGDETYEPLQFGHPCDSTKPPNFKFQRFWMKNIQAELFRRHMLVGVPIAWSFRTEVWIGLPLVACVDMTINMQQTHIPCELVTGREVQPEGKVLWQSLEDTDAIHSSKTDSVFEAKQISEEELDLGQV